jgi:hypothetical protein
MSERRECPICHVQTPGGVTCAYHKSARKQHEEGAVQYRARYYIKLLSEYVDEARNPSRPV